MKRKGKRGLRILILPLTLGLLALLFGRSLSAPARAWLPGLLGGEDEGAETLSVPAGDFAQEHYVFQTPDTKAPPQASAQPVVSAEAEASGELRVKNRTNYNIDTAALLAEPLSITLDPDAPQILILHTHGSEAYTPEGEDVYEPSDPSRTEDKNYNMVRVGDELAAALTAQGFNVLHDRELYDYPSYNGSYTRSLEAVERYLAEYPSIQLVLDIHRDAVLLEDGSLYKTTAQVDGESCAQVMLCVGTDESGLEHPGWRENLKLGLHIQQALWEKDPALARPLSLVSSRYNQHAAPGSLIVEIGYNGNSLQEALAAARVFADAAGGVFSSLF